MLYLIGVSLYSSSVALTGSESGRTHLPPRCLEGLPVFFPLLLLVLVRPTSTPFPHPEPELLLF